MKVCILGYGTIAKSHLKGYLATMAAGGPQELVGVCDIDPARFDDNRENNLGEKALTLPQSIPTYTDYEEMLARQQPDIVDLCIPTYLHCEYTCKLLEMGYHVQCEKPMALTPEECQKMIDTAERTGKKLMVGMVLRFEPLYLELKKMIEDNRFGAVKSAYFDRLSFLPKWGFENWFPDVKRSGGVALDMHIHDVDMISYLFGAPDSVSAATVGTEECECITIHSAFHYPDKIVTAIGDWGRAPESPFSMSYRVNFEKATVISDTEGNITVYPFEGESYRHEYEHLHRMQQEELYFASIVAGAQNTVLPNSDAMQSVVLVHKLLQSAAKGGEKVRVK